MPSPSLNAPFSSYQAKLPHSGFNIGRRFLFTAAPHQILPVFSQVCNPGDKFHINTAANVQMQKILKPAHLMIDQRVEWFFVPMSMIYTPFPNIMYETNDLISSAVDTSCDLPLLNMKAIYADNMPLNQWASDEAEALLYQPKLSFRSFTDEILPISRFDTFTKGCFRLLMHLGYNPFVVGVNNYNDWKNTDGVWLNTLQGDWQPNIFPAHAAAYQCIYQNYPFFRNDDREKRRLRSYQLDYLASGSRSTVVSDLDSDDFADLFSLRYCQRPKDYFTSMRVNPIMSALNVLSDNLGSGTVLLSRVNSYLDESDPVSYDKESVVSYDYSPSQNGVTAFGQGNYNDASFSTSILRSVFAVEKLMRITGRAKKDYDSQVLAHFGFKVPHDVKHDLTHIGGFEGSFDVQRIVATSNTAYDGSIDNTNLGELGGNGYGSIKGKPLNFTAPCHGILMAVYYTVCRNSYPLGRMIDRQTVLTDRLSFYQPEFDRLGDQPLFGYEVGIMSNDLNDESQPELEDICNLQLGWSRRYEHFKRKYDVHSLAFAQPFVTDQYGPLLQNVVNTWSPWVLGRQPFYNLGYDIDTPNITNAYPQGFDFMGAPTDLDNIMVQQYKTYMSEDDFIKPWLTFQTDPFMVALTTDVKMISSMSVTGEPELD